ncbi:MAG: DUF4062 domain-containing protein [Flammeovirgaceae bacterium]
MQHSSLYISYHQPDFRSDRSHIRDWIHGFIETLQVLFIQSHAVKPDIYHTPYGDTDDTVQPIAVEQADIFVAIVTENYQSSPKCMAELNQFLAKKTDSRSVFKVLRNAVAVEKQPKELASLPAYEFFEYDVDSEITVEYNNTGRLPDYKYWVKLDDLVYGIAHFLEGNGKNQVGVYLASTTIDQKQVREALARNLKHRGFVIFPQTAYDVTDPDLKEKILKNLEQCSLSVHLMGEVFGEVINEEGDSLVSLENEIALRYSIDHVTLKRIVRVPRELHVMETKQQTYLEYLRAHKELQSNSYYLETSLENLKAHMHDLLSSPNIFGQSSQLQSLFFAAPTVTEWLPKLQEIMKGTGFSIITPEDFKYWSEHQTNLGNADVLLLIDVPHNLNWVTNWMKSLFKIKGYRTKSNEINGILITDEPSTLSGIKNLIKFKVLSVKEFQQNPRGVLDFIT